MPAAWNQFLPVTFSVLIEIPQAPHFARTHGGGGKLMALNPEVIPLQLWPRRL